MPKPGFLTPSTFADLMSNGRGSETMGKTALAVVNQLTMDMLGVERSDGYTPDSCQWGIDHEWEAIQEYEERTFRTVQHPVEFTVSHTHGYVGGTMDGLVGTKLGGIEVKCPVNSSNHLANITSALQFETLYKYQLQGYFWIFELKWIDCVSYDPRFPEPSKISIYRVYPDEKVIQSLKERCELAYSMARDMVKSLGGE